MALTASADQQLKLLDLATIDTKLMQLNHQRAGVPEIKLTQDLEIELGSIELRIVAADTEVSDLTQNQAKAESDVLQVASRIAKDQAKLDGGQASPKELEGLQHELGTLAGRLNELEDVELEVMQQLEDAQNAYETLTHDRNKVAAELADAKSILNSKLADLDSQIAEEKSNKDSVLIELPKELADLYEKVRLDHGDVGAAKLEKGSCQGCHIALDATELNRIKTLPPETVLRCEECRRILVRVAGA